MSHAPLRIAFCGLGRMGTEMVGVLVERGVGVTVWNRSADRAAALAETIGVEVADSPAAAARGVDVIFTMLTDGPAVLDTLSRQDGVLAGAPPGAIVVDCSTVGRQAAVEAANLCAESGIRFVDCPVSGSTLVARQGRLGLMAGGDAAVINEVKPVLEMLGTLVHVGPTGAGAAAKVAVNALLHTFSTALSECLVAASAAGVSPDALFDVLEAGVLWNRFLDYKRPAFTDPEHAQVAFDLRTATKDLDLGVLASEQAELPISVVAKARDIHRRALTDGYGDQDMAAMAAWFTYNRRTADHAPTTGNPAPAPPERN